MYFLSLPLIPYTKNTYVLQAVCPKSHVTIITYFTHSAPYMMYKIHMYFMPSAPYIMYKIHMYFMPSAPYIMYKIHMYFMPSASYPI